jgi:hypothetical protein
MMDTMGRQDASDTSAVVREVYEELDELLERGDDAFTERGP